METIQKIFSGLKPLEPHSGRIYKPPMTCPRVPGLICITSVEGKHPTGNGPVLCARDPYGAGTHLSDSKLIQDSYPRELLVGL